MRALTSAALRAIYTHSKPQACQFIADRHFAFSRRSFLSSHLQQNDPTKGLETKLNHAPEETVTPPRSQDALQEVDEFVENASGPQTPSKPKDLSGYGSAAKRAGRHVKKVKELPPLQFPKWFLDDNIVLREDSSKAIGIRLIEPETPNIGEVSSLAPSSSKEIKNGEKYGTEDRNEREKETGDCPGSEDKSNKVEKFDTHTTNTHNSQALELTASEHLDQDSLDQDSNSNRLGEDEAVDNKLRPYYKLISNDKAEYGIDADIMHEISSIVSATLRSHPRQEVDSWTSSKPDLILHHPKDGGSYFLDSLVSHLTALNNADLIRLNAQDLAEIGGNYLDEQRETHTTSLSSLGYDAYHTASIRASMRASHDLEDSAEEDEMSNIEDDDESQPKSGIFQASNISIIPMARIGGSILDMLNSASASHSNPSPNSKTPSNTNSLVQASDTTRDLKISHFLETILNASEWKRGMRNNQQGSTLHVTENTITNSSIESMIGDADKLISKRADEAEPAKPRDANSDLITDYTPIIAPNSDLKPLTGPLVIMISDYLEINMTSSGSKILDRLHKIAANKRREGQKIIIIGACTSKDLVPTIARRGFMNAHFERGNGPTRTIVTPCHSQLSGTLSRDHDRRIRAINSRNLQDMLRRLSLVPSNVDLLKEVHDSSDDIWKNLWSLDFVHRLATVTLGMSEESGQINGGHVKRALETLARSEKAKHDWIDQEEREAETSTGTSSSPIRDSEERMKKLRRSCNAYEKKLLSGVIDPHSIHTTFADVRAPKDTVEALKTLTSLSLVRPDAFKYGVLATDKIPGLLLYGPPGTGKTLLAKAVAKESGATVLEVSGSDVYDMYVGEGEKNVKAIFTLAKKLTPCIVFIDEADAILGSRGSASNRTTHRELINQFLREWDGMNELSAFIMVATNRPFDLDEASLRRLPRRLLVDLPTEADREAILKIHLKDERLDPTISLATIASQTPFYSGSDLKNLAVAAALACVREEFDQAAAGVSSSIPPAVYKYPKKRTLSLRHFTHAMGEISASISEDMGSLSAIRKFDEKFGDRRGRRKKLGGYGFETVKAEERNLSDSARVRNLN